MSFEQGGKRSELLPVRGGGVRVRVRRCQVEVRLCELLAALPSRSLTRDDLLLARAGAPAAEGRARGLGSVRSGVLSTLLVLLLVEALGLAPGDRVLLHSEAVVLPRFGLRQPEAPAVAKTAVAPT